MEGRAQLEDGAEGRSRPLQDRGEGWIKSGEGRAAPVCLMAICFRRDLIVSGLGSSCGER